MPVLKQISCSIEIGSGAKGIPLKDYAARYGDGIVESFVAVPKVKMPFSIRVVSRGYIAPGLAAFVYIDGECHANRNRLGLPMPGEFKDPRACEIDFTFRQKEEKLPGGEFVARDWSFAELNTSECA
jgi:hypothetical protein